MWVTVLAWVRVACALAMLVLGVGIIWGERLPGPAWLWPRSKPGTSERTRRLLGAGFLSMGTSILGFAVMQLAGLPDDGGWIVAPIAFLGLAAAGLGAAAWAMWRSIREGRRGSRLSEPQ